MALLSICEN
jgi:hypothetical protein